MRRIILWKFNQYIKRNSHQDACKARHRTIATGTAGPSTRSRSARCTERRSGRIAAPSRCARATSPAPPISTTGSGRPAPSSWYLDWIGNMKTELLKKLIFNSSDTYIERLSINNGSVQYNLACLIFKRVPPPPPPLFNPFWRGMPRKT